MKLAVIPARGGSKRIPRKNIKLFAGKPMIAYAIEAAINAKIFDHIYVSTDDTEIAEISREYGAEIPFIRPPELSDDFTATVPVIQHAINACIALHGTPKYVCCIYPSVPLIESKDLTLALKTLELKNAESCFTVTEFPSAPQRALKKDVGERMCFAYPDFAMTRSQDLEKNYFDAGQFYWATTQNWLSGNNSERVGFPIPIWRSVDIDTLEDWKRAELYYEAIHRPKI